MNLKTIIEMKYTNSINQADKLDQIAASLQRVSDSDLNSALQTINTNWKGDNATAYLGKVNVVKSDIHKTALDLKKTANAIRTIARNVYKAEMNAYRIAIERKYGS